MPVTLTDAQMAQLTTLRQGLDSLVDSLAAPAVTTLPKVTLQAISNVPMTSYWNVTFQDVATGNRTHALLFNLPGSFPQFASSVPMAVTLVPAPGSTEYQQVSAWQWNANTLDKGQLMGVEPDPANPGQVTLFFYVAGKSVSFNLLATDPVLAKLVVSSTVLYSFQWSAGTPATVYASTITTTPVS